MKSLTIGIPALSRRTANNVSSLYFCPAAKPEEVNRNTTIATGIPIDVFRTKCEITDSVYADDLEIDFDLFCSRLPGLIEPVRRVCITAELNSRMPLDEAIVIAT